MGIDRIEEPTGLSQPAGDIGNTARTDASRSLHRGREDAYPRAGREEHDAPIFDLLGSHLGDHGQDFYPAADQHVPQSTSIDGSGLMGTLYVHYCKALDAPQSLMSGAWVSSTPSLPLSTSTHEHDPTWDSHAGGAISGLFPDIERVDQAFGRLGIGEALDLGGDDGVPEILRLFAPPEYSAKPHGEPVRPPALTQREHHTLAIDSPLTELNGSAGQTNNHS
ncbi:TagK domain-containing protein [Paraburkholderia bannensis]|uniref:TagK domain-containing protein n=1 Tax=Paraburkholderia bannensis TaxID=765414 RepID=UPI001427E09E|nr:TagK domain-containing protein [Paraburkholderia bannensis]